MLESMLGQAKFQRELLVDKTELSDNKLVDVL
jgi:hypothetical protein